MIRRGLSLPGRPEPCCRGLAPAGTAMLLIAVVAGCATGKGTPRVPDGGARDASADATPDSAVDADTGDCDPACASGDVCVFGRCLPACLDGLCDTGTCCGGVCVDVTEDPHHCGACGGGCGPTGNACLDSECLCGAGPACRGGDTCCFGRCADLSSQASNCGACGRTCGDNERCEGGACVPLHCDPPCADEEECVGGPGGGECRCGFGAACGAERSCCRDACFPTEDDDENCGGCGIRCALSQTCVASSCTEGVGACSPSCAAGEACVSGVCRCGLGPACGGGESCCDGTCVAVSSSVENCGRCGNACIDGESCCNGECVDTTTDRDHCGDCFARCAASADRCTSGQCRCGSSNACSVPPLCVNARCGIF